MDAPRNRKQRRAAAASNKDTFDPSSIPLSRPPQDHPSQAKVKGKTLVDLISQRQNELLQEGKSTGSPGTLRNLETSYVTIDPATGKISPFEGISEGGDRVAVSEDASNNEGSQFKENNDDPIPPFLDTLLLSFPLTVLHLTLAYLAAHQYAQSIEMDKLIRESGFVAFPILTVVIHFAHGHIFSFGRRAKESQVISLFPWHSSKLSLAFLRKLMFPPSWRTVVFLPLAVFLGAKLMIMTNEDPYYAVMKRAPAIGTLWVWCILEIPVGAAALGALGPLAWGVWWRGYGII